ncbi:GNAT family N-acetyltransferase [Sediminibacterium roseum]|uniref:GNAT family N-acetyltransferase n=1 Tax=Sediminibacterium roseum TaxID=1978412 RepID=A0ABX0A3W5_9BACT|nr:GNAT family N-acetyltransferase [Sediminibacterium roseum]NCI51846.1 GNAT family N-acetyltransferase [Sediminibacterium roseum]
MQNLKIRKAISSDLPLLRLFEQGVIEAERPFDKTLKQDPIQYYDLDLMLIAKHIHLVVAEVDGQPVASGYARIEDAKPYNAHAKHAYLGFMYTVAEHRGKGINQEIIKELKRWAKEQGIAELRLDVYYSNASAIRAYEKAGFSKHMVAMRADVG